MTTSDNHRDPGILDDLAEQDSLTAEERDPEASPEDVQEQVTLADPAGEEDEHVRVPQDASEWDAVEQARVVELDEDYR